jgi:hypothetical protein
VRPSKRPVVAHKPNRNNEMFLDRIHRQLNQIEQNQKTIMDTQADLDQAIADLGTALDAGVARVVAKITALQQGPNFATEKAALLADTQKLTDLVPDAPPAP